jgi:hypothetical protein
MRIPIEDPGTMYDKSKAQTPNISRRRPCANDDMGIAGNDMVHSDTLTSVEHLWGRTTDVPRGTEIVVDTDTHAPPMRVAENDFIERHEGAEGKAVLVRRGLHLKGAKYTETRTLVDPDWPSFDDDV